MYKLPSSFKKGLNNRFDVTPKVIKKIETCLNEFDIKSYEDYIDLCEKCSRYYRMYLQKNNKTRFQTKDYVNIALLAINEKY